MTRHPSQNTKFCQCGYRHQKNYCPASGKQCYNCSSTGHFTAMCRSPRNSRSPQDSSYLSRTLQRRSSTHRHSSQLLSQIRQSCRSTSCNPSYTCIQCRSPHCTNRNRRSPTPYIHEVSLISFTSPNPNEADGMLLTDTASYGQTSFHTTPSNQNKARH